MKNSSFWTLLLERTLSTYAIVTFAVLWIGFLTALVINQEWLTILWHWIRALPLVAEAVVWIFFTPVPVLLWIWVSSWSGFVDFLAYAGMVGWTLLAVNGFLRAFR